LSENYITMGANYYRIIMNLISFKEELKLVEGKKFKPLIFELEKYQIPEDDFDDNIPSNKEIANKLIFHNIIDAL